MWMNTINTDKYIICKAAQLEVVECPFLSEKTLIMDCILEYVKQCMKRNSQFYHRDHWKYVEIIISIIIINNK